MHLPVVKRPIFTYYLAQMGVKWIQQFHEGEWQQFHWNMLIGHCDSGTLIFQNMLNYAIFEQKGTYMSTVCFRG